MSSGPVSNFAQPLWLSAGNNIPGAPTLYLSLSISYPDPEGPGSVGGQGVVVQAVTPPGGRTPVRNVHGQLYRLGGPNELLDNVLVLTGSCVVTSPPSEVVREEPFLAAFVLGPEGNGYGTYSCGQRVINNVPAKKDRFGNLPQTEEVEESLGA